jgi:integrase
MLDDQGITVTESLHLDYHIDRFIETQRRKCSETKISAGRLAKIISTIETYRKWSSIVRVDKIGTRDHIDAYRTFLSNRVITGEIKGKYANNLFSDFKMLIDWLFNNEVLKTYPVCLQRKSNDYKFPVVRQPPVVIPLKWVQKILNVTESRMKLCILLTLNCGFGASEIGQLTKDEYDPVAGRITHKRCKTQKYANVPTVCYKLWGETKALLDQEIASNRKKYPKTKWLLVNSNGSPLWSEYVGGDGTTHKSDNITSAFKRLIAKLRKSDPEFPKVAYYQFRKTSATLIFNEPEYMGLDWLWLGHAPNTTAGQHYTAPTPTILDKCLVCLHNRIFSSAAPVEVETVKIDKI